MIQKKLKTACGMRMVLIPLADSRLLAFLTHPIQTIPNTMDGDSMNRSAAVALSSQPQANRDHAG
jgi:hypothetical protein